MYGYSILPEALVKKEGTSFFTHPVGSGPFMVSSYNPNTEVDLTAQPVLLRDQAQDRQGPRPRSCPMPTPGRCCSRAARSTSSRTPPANLVSEIGRHQEGDRGPLPVHPGHFLQLDEHFKPFKSVLVRQAINYAIDRAAIVKLAYDGNATAAASFFPKGMEYFDSSLKPYPYDPAKAKALLAKAGYAKGFKAFVITVSGDTPAWRRHW